MKHFGVVYDVGLRFTPGLPYSVDPFDPVLVEHDLRTIAQELHANAVRIEGEEIERLVIASRIAHKLGLSVFFNPWKMNADAAELRPYYAEAAREAETLRQEGVDIAYVAGCEYPIFQRGILPGDTLADRLGGIGALFAGTPEQVQERMRPLWPGLNEILKSFVEVIRPEFKGPVTYAATAFEEIDWSVFDIVGVDYYRHGEAEQDYVAGLDRYRQDKPLVVMEVGCCTYEGAGPRGAGGFMLLQGVEADGSGKFVDGVVPTRSEGEQADYAGEQLELLSRAGVDGVFIYVFSFPAYCTGEGAKDLDMMSFALVKTFPHGDPRSREMPPWAPKEAFHRVADFYRRHAAAAAPAN